MSKAHANITQSHHHRILLPWHIKTTIQQKKGRGRQSKLTRILGFRFVKHFIIVSINFWSLYQICLHIENTSDENMTMGHSASLSLSFCATIPYHSWYNPGCSAFYIRHSVDSSQLLYNTLATTRMLLPLCKRMDYLAASQTTLLLLTTSFPSSYSLLLLLLLSPTLSTFLTWKER